MKTIILRYNRDAAIRHLGSVDALKEWLANQVEWAFQSDVSLTIEASLPDGGEWVMWCY